MALVETCLCRRAGILELAPTVSQRAELGARAPEDVARSGCEISADAQRSRSSRRGGLGGGLRRAGAGTVRGASAWGSAALERRSPAREPLPVASLASQKRSAAVLKMGAPLARSAIPRQRPPPERPDKPQPSPIWARTP